MAIDSGVDSSIPTATNKADDITEWSDLVERLLIANPDKFDELLDAMRKIVEAQETLASFDWQLMFRGRPTKRYLA